MDCLITWLWLAVLCSCEEQRRYQRQHNTVIGPPQTIIAVAGDDVTLPCRLESKSSAVDKTIEWTRPDLEPPYVHIHRNGGEESVWKHPWYMYRTALFLEELGHGNVSLMLFRVILQDAGEYHCLVPSSDITNPAKPSIVSLTVCSKSTADISLVAVNDSGVVLQCESKGWYPQPEVSWLDSEGNILPAEPSEKIRGPDGLYAVRSNVTVKNTVNNTFTCRVHLTHLNQNMESTIYIPASLFPNQYWITEFLFGLAVGLLIGLLTLVYLTSNIQLTQ